MGTQITNITTIHKGEYRDLVGAEFVTSAGNAQTWEYLHEYNESVIVLPITIAGSMVLIDEFRIPIQTKILSLPAGTFDPNIETAHQCAQRELREETGYVSKNLVSLGLFYGAPAISDRKMELFVAFDVERVGELELDEAEDISVVEHTYDAVQTLFQKNSLSVSPFIFLAYEMAKNKFPENFSL